ncbi:hypothetical protein EST38_g9621 [Candolleomyces aberdarensis]|uniref:Uncharacterized protein n=1 Tax=Candolleomyces aberdarensis TaxID=2316362 RepID=A0A4Q2DA53_9AGAR|nr:hypothetical protein EST38_g9621 [Candolleomyces aberdarensis]
MTDEVTLFPVPDFAKMFGVCDAPIHLENAIRNYGNLGWAWRRKLMLYETWQNKAAQWKCQERNRTRAAYVTERTERLDRARGVVVSALQLAPGESHSWDMSSKQSHIKFIEEDIDQGAMKYYDLRGGALACYCRISPLPTVEEGNSDATSSYDTPEEHELDDAIHEPSPTEEVCHVEGFFPAGGDLGTVPTIPTSLGKRGRADDILSDDDPAVRFFDHRSTDAAGSSFSVDGEQDTGTESSYAETHRNKKPRVYLPPNVCEDE